MFCINPIKLKDLFPLPEIYEYTEVILKDYLMNNNLKKYQIKNRWHRNYYGDGIFTNDIEVMKDMMKHILK